jgi:predicted phage terminase large subunit-like protein
MEIRELVKRAFQRDLSDPSALSDAFDSIRLLEPADFKLAHERNKEVRRLSAKFAAEQKSLRMFELNKRSLLFDAPYDFDAHCRYIEWNREPSKRFYLPRRKQLYRVAKALQRLADNELDLLAISLPPGVGKTTLALFFLTWLGGRNPEKPILGGSHSNAFLRGVYDECIRIMDPQGDYLWNDVFPVVKVVKTNAQDMMIDLGTDPKKGKRFATLEFSSVGSGNAGKVRAENLLYCDDLVDGLESALSKERMDKLWNLYATDLRQRKIGDCKELHIATRWSIHDVIGRLEQSYGESGRAEFIVMPALDENDESNFDYGNHAGFTTAFYHEQREVMDDASWRALYMNQPIEREGQLYSEDELRRYFELPDRKPDAILFVCDTKDKGTDYCVMPICYQYGNDFYCEDVVCDNSNPEVVEARLVSKLLQHKAQMGQFESNSAGGKVAEKVQKEVKESGGIAKITTKYTTSNKETRIIVNSPFIKDRVLFKDNSVIKKDKEYRRMLNFLCGYTMAGKNRNDDVPDAWSLFAEYVQQLEGNKVEVFRRPF